MAANNVAEITNTIPLVMKATFKPIVLYVNPKTTTETSRVSMAKRTIKDMI
jgi:hypothetical protein